MIALFYLALACIAVWFRRDLIAVALLLFLLVSMAIWPTVPRDWLHVALCLIESAMAMCMASIIITRANAGNDVRFIARRARAIIIISCLKIVAWTLYTAVNGAWITAASINNAGLIVQILVAGGVGFGAMGKIGDNAAGIWRRVVGFISGDSASQMDEGE